jgi:hypothetical protein
MLLILLSPFLALFADMVRQKFSISKLWASIIALLMTVPSLLVWLTGYSYSDRLGNYFAITLFISGILFAVYTFEDSELKSKTKPSIILFVVIGIFILFFSFSQIFSQRTDKVFSTISNKAYKAIHSGDFDLVLSGPQRIEIKRIKFNGLIEKTIYNETLPNPDTIPNCTLYIKDKAKKISFNYCKNVLTVEN